MHHRDDYTDVHDAGASSSSLVFAMRPAKTRQDLTGNQFSGGLAFSQCKVFQFTSLQFTLGPASLSVGIQTASMLSADKITSEDNCSRGQSDNMIRTCWWQNWLQIARRLVAEVWSFKDTRTGRKERKMSRKYAFQGKKNYISAVRAVLSNFLLLRQPHNICLHQKSLWKHVKKD